MPSKSRPPKPYNPSSTIVRPRHLPDAVGISSLTAKRLRQQEPPDFPEPIRLSAGAVGWTRESLDAWIASRGER
jgi:predicted DNA-binding transcriptional regulator AlpA